MSNSEATVKARGEGKGRDRCPGSNRKPAEVAAETANRRADITARSPFPPRTGDHVATPRGDPTSHAPNSSPAGRDRDGRRR